MLRRFLHSFLKESKHYEKGFPDHIHLERGLVEVSGPDAGHFLQGLTSNDIYALHSDGQGQYNAFLNHKGRVLFDMFVYRLQSNRYLIECQRPYAEDIYVHMLIYKLKSDVQFNVVTSQYQVFGSFHQETETILSPLLKSNLILTHKDTRCDWPFYRHILASNNQKETMILNGRPGTRQDYRTLRCVYGVSEGFRELKWNEGIPHEYNLDLMQALHFNKGCYIGQELVNRVEAKGLVRKRILPLKLITVDDFEAANLTDSNWNLNPGNDLKKYVALDDIGFAMRLHDEAGKQRTGTLYNVNMQIKPAIITRVEGNIAMAKCRLDVVLKSPYDKIMFYDQYESHKFYVGLPYVPSWWPSSIVQSIEPANISASISKEEVSSE